MQFVWNSAAQKAAINQMIAIIQRDQTDALAIINADRATAGNDDLPPIEEFHKGSAARTALPWLSFGAGVAAFDRESQQLRKADFTVSMVLDVGQFDQEMAQDNGIDYARMLDGIIGASWKQTPSGLGHGACPSTTRRCQATSRLRLRDCPTLGSSLPASRRASSRSTDMRSRCFASSSRCSSARRMPTRLNFDMEERS